MEGTSGRSHLPHPILIPLEVVEHCVYTVAYLGEGVL